MTPEQIAKGLSALERERLMRGRRDWRDDDWQDHCGAYTCDHCSGYIDQHDNTIGDSDPIGLAVRAILEKQDD